MEQLIKIIPLSPDLAIYLAIDIVIAVILLFSLRALSGLFSSISVRKELEERDNFAFGISLAGKMLSLLIVLSAVVGRHSDMDFMSAAFSMLMFGGSGILLVKIGRFAHDKLVLNQLDKDKMIAEKNVSVAMVDASSSIACAIVAHSIINWVQGTDIDAFVALFSGVVMVMAVLLFATRVYEYRFAENSQNSGFQKTLSDGQLALSIVHSGNLIAIAIAVSTAKEVLIYTPQAYVTNATSWLIAGFALAASLMILTSICKRIVLLGVGRNKEIVLQHNIGLASIEAMLAIGIALLFSNLF